MTLKSSTFEWAVENADVRDRDIEIDLLRKNCDYLDAGQKQELLGELSQVLAMDFNVVVFQILLGIINMFSGKLNYCRALCKQFSDNHIDSLWN